MATGWPMKTTYANGDVYSASDVNDITGTINLLGSSVAYTAGKNKIINGDFGIWQRGTSFTTPSYAYTADRWTMDAATAFATSITVSRQTFTPGTAPVSGYEGTYFYRLVYTKAASQTAQYVKQRIEDVRQLAGQTATISFWAKCDAARSIGVSFDQNFGSGGSGTVSTSAGTASATTAWQRFSYSVSIPSISGKTIGTSSFLEVIFTLPNASSTTDIWGVQLEQGSTATAFQTATGTIQGELAACQRYFQVICDGALDSAMAVGIGHFYSSTQAEVPVRFPVQLRGTPSMTFSAVGDFRITQGGSTYRTVTSLTSYNQTPLTINISPSASTSTATAGAATYFTANSTAAAKIYVSAEL